MAPILTGIVYRIIEKGYWLEEWKSSIVKRLYKSKVDKLYAKLYHPVFLTSALRRTVERMLTSKLIEHLLQNDLLSEECHGFVPGRGTVTAVLEILEKFKRAWTMGMS